MSDQYPVDETKQAYVPPKPEPLSAGPVSRSIAFEEAPSSPAMDWDFAPAEPDAWGFSDDLAKGSSAGGSSAASSKKFGGYAHLLQRTTLVTAVTAPISLPKLASLPQLPSMIFSVDELWAEADSSDDEAAVSSDLAANLFPSPSCPSLTVDVDETAEVSGRMVKLLGTLQAALSSPDCSCKAFPGQYKVSVVSFVGLQRCEYAVQCYKTAQPARFELEFQRHTGSLSALCAEARRCHANMSGRVKALQLHASAGANSAAALSMSAGERCVPRTVSAPASALDASTLDLVLGMASSSCCDVQREGLRTLASVSECADDAAALCSQPERLATVLAAALASPDPDVCWTAACLLVNTCAQQDAAFSAAARSQPELLALLSSAATASSPTPLQGKMVQAQRQLLQA